MEDGRWWTLISTDGSQWWVGFSENTGQWNGSTAIFISNAVMPNMIVMICFSLSAFLSNISLPLRLIYPCTRNLTLSKSSDHSVHYDSRWCSVCVVFTLILFKKLLEKRGESSLTLSCPYSTLVPLSFTLQFIFNLLYHMTLSLYLSPFIVFTIFIEFTLFFCI